MKTENRQKLPASPGVYIFKNKKGEVIYIGKAANLRRRVASYFTGKREAKVLRIAENTVEIEFEKTDSVMEAFIREAQLIKEHSPQYNIKEKDDRSFLYVIITDEHYPRVLLKRGREKDKIKAKSIFGPFIYSSQIRYALRTIRKIFPFSTHTEKEIKKGKPCFYYQIGLCPGTCAGVAERKEYLKEIKNIELFFEGKKKKVLSRLKKEMEKASKALEFERAEKIKRKINALSHIHDTALLGREKQEGKRIEGYDISNISGNFAVGAMVVFSGDNPRKKEYRLFKIRTIKKQDDTGMLKEALTRRFKNEWPLPHLILIDGGEGQVNAAKEEVESAGLDIPVLGIAKGEGRKQERLVGEKPKDIKKETLLHVQSEAHRFALNYHRKLRNKNLS